ncbi:hypothetical protein [Arthrobacter sp. PsM3]|uniref:hypothetical protein n=1 Tax=Arthrobacter sp. PsM3 TaxID=3030531 RepID=UPI00263BD024|nr:hypothetical protein [Arthrobacter sp. PsM3]MDN4645985.1 hypothetical protein [Arthrobacter sp. PsM3]
MPKVSGGERFCAFAAAGRKVSNLHIGYEAVEPCALTEVATGLVTLADEYDQCSLTRMKYAGKAGAWDKTRIVLQATETPVHRWR